VDAFSSHNFFASEPSFGGENVPNFGSSVKDDTPNRDAEMTYSPANRSDFSGDGSQKKAKSVLNDGDGLPVEPKFMYSQEKSKYKKSKSTHEEDPCEASFGGFNIDEFKPQKPRTKSQLQTDDEITNTDTAIDIFGDKFKKTAEEGLPSFGSLVVDSKKAETTRRKSYNAPEIGGLGSHFGSANYSNNDAEHQAKSSNDHSISGRYKGNMGTTSDDGPSFGAFGMNVFKNNQNYNKPVSEKPKKQSI
jgi:hypothetical protein